ncbi:DUF6691 family protein [Polyangium fumosum]|uniref:YeeE/YedE family protein n=1 Tax=Polyangium fumosum TaxID=889272 RepID=A0A4U1IWB4_9BACT|nr:DUF6691 family protein [Polyangium fumosum]TKC98747.1 YeeE/YedE family protein [Polyangium fumosum]
MKSFGAAFAAGALFAAGLGGSGMTDPTKVLGFLDVTGAWDPSLAFVMLGAVGAHFVTLRLILRRGGPIFGGSFQIPTRKDIDVQLIAGAAVFGVGWGLGGYCPGPALASLSTLAPAVLVFIATMVAGMLLQHLTADL